MNNDEKANRIIYWVSIAFIVVCLSFAMTAKAYDEDNPDPCKFEYDNAVSVCRALGRKSPECRKAVTDYKLCKAAEGGNDPLEGLTQRCVTECHTNSLGITQCITRCYDERGRRS